MQYSKWEYQNIALAAVAQCAAGVDALAVRGSTDETSVAVCTAPLLNFDPDSVAEIYPNISQLSFGLRTLQEIFSQQRQAGSSEIIRYILGILALRQKLMSDKRMQEKLHAELEKIILPESYPEQCSEQDLQQFYKQLAEVYQNTISTYTFRIHVKGSMNNLKDQAIADKTRALLLAGIRAAVLWYQIGGRRWHLILYRKKITQTSARIRKSLITSV